MLKDSAASWQSERADLFLPDMSAISTVHKLSLVWHIHCVTPSCDPLWILLLVFVIYVSGVSGPAAISLLSLGLQPVSGIWSSSAIIPPVEVLPRASPSDSHSEVEAQVVALQRHCSSSWDKLLVAELAHTENINHFKPKISEQCNSTLLLPCVALLLPLPCSSLVLTLRCLCRCSCLCLCLALALPGLLLTLSSATLFGTESTFVSC